ncbi:MAG TPA: hypothetical protein VF138_09275 [Caulobacteraceae bacterium]
MKTEHVDADGRTVVHDTDNVALSDKDLRAAYERGRDDERSRHGRNWLLTIITALLALVGVIVLVLAALNGSFQRAGMVMDRQLSIAADQAEPAVRNAASEASAAIQDVRTGNDADANPDVVQTPTGPQPAPNTTAPEAR